MRQRKRPQTADGGVMTMKTQRSNTALTGAAGEHYVICQLLRQNFIAALAPQGAPNADIIVTDPEGERLCAIQVKTRRDIGSDKGWHMSKKHETIVSERLFYCFVEFGIDITTQPKCYIVPSAIVARILKLSHKNWLETPGKKGLHNDTDMRRFLPDYSMKFSTKEYSHGWLNCYHEAWDSLRT